MEDRTWLRDEPLNTTSSQAVSSQEYRRIIMSLLFLAVFAAGTVYIISLATGSSLWIKLALIPVWSLFALAGLLITDLANAPD